jgi:hypothetical protein
MATTSFNESAYGPIADSYAAKYGIPTDKFRDVIRASSNFDPMYSGSKGDGIGGMIAGNGVNFNPFDISSSLDYLGNAMAAINKDTKDWQTTTDSMLNGYNSQIYDNVAEVDQQLKAAQEREATESAANNKDKAFWEYTTDDWKFFFKKSAWGILFFVLGGVLIIGSVYVVISKSGDAGK